MLLVDDTVEILDSTSRFLRRQGYRIVTSASSFGVTRLLHEHEADAIVLDVAMPGLDGGQLATILRQTLPEIPIIFYSGISATELAAVTNRIDGSTFVAKRDGVRALWSEIRSAVGRRTEPDLVAQ